MREIAIVAGALANKPLNGGAAWTRLSWTLGLAQIGFEVYFLEQISESDCRDADGAPAPFESSLNLDFFKTVTRAFDLVERSALICDSASRIHGMTRSEILDLAASARLLLNISGQLKLEQVLDRIPLKVYLDLDPGFTQFWHAQGQPELGLERHDLHFTVGENIGRPGCPIPSGGFDWQPVRQPVLLDYWPAVEDASLDRFTTVATWRGPYGPIRFAGKEYGLKVHQFRKYLDLPSRTGLPFELALDIHPDEKADLKLLRDAGWRIIDPKSALQDPAGFRSYVQGSGAEFSVAQGVYADTSSGWFADRTVRYLASGRPALVQDTGFSRNLPCGDGLLAFRTLEEAVVAVRRIAEGYRQHCQAARSLAEEHFNSRKVLSELVGRAGISP